MSRYRSCDGLRVGVEGPVLHLVLDRPEKRNSLHDDSVAGMIAALEAAATDDSLRAVLLTGAGEHFCGGFDIVGRNSAGGLRPRVGSIQRRLPQQAHRLIPLIREVQLPVVCLVRGWAVGIGFQLALACDLTLVAEDARLWEPFATRGFTPDSGATWLLPQLVGPARAKELLMLGRELSGREAADWGLVLSAQPPDDLEAAGRAVLDRVASGPTVALGLTKRLVNSAWARPLGAHLAEEAYAMELSSRASDFKEAMAALAERRRPDFTGS